HRDWHRRDRRHADRHTACSVPCAGILHQRSLGIPWAPRERRVAAHAARARGSRMSGGLARMLAVTLPALLSACTLEPNYYRPPSPVPALVDGSRYGMAASTIAWREFFPDPQLQRLIAVALANNRDLRIAALNVQYAQARYRIQRANLFPTVDASALEEVERFPPGVIGPSTSGGLPAAGTLRFYNVG